MTETAESEFIFGYGSIINNDSRHLTLQSLHTGNTNDNFAVLATISPKFGYKRSWCYRSSTGFTALGLQPFIVENNNTNVKHDSEQPGICGVLFAVKDIAALNAFDLRESGYYRAAVPLHLVTISHQGAAIPAIGKVWIYIPEPNRINEPDENFPILQTYVDICVRGCHEWGGKALVNEFLLSTIGWSCMWLNDCPLARRPW